MSTDRNSGHGARDSQLTAAASPERAADWGLTAAATAPQPLTDSVAEAMQRTAAWLLAHQHRDGYWCGELEGDTILESEYVLLLAWLGRQDAREAREAAAYIQRQQLPAGGWAQYPGGPVDISGSVKAYFALKLAGYDAASEPMQRARRAILQHGGADQVNSFTRFYLALLGQIDYEHCPAVPPEAVLLPSWLPVNIYRISAWSRTILVPLSIIWARRPVRSLSPEQGIAELFIRSPQAWPPLRCPGLPAETGLVRWESIFRWLDRAWRWAERHGWRPLRRQALQAAEQWMLERFQESDGLGAIFPPIIWSVVALRCLGYDDESPELRYCYEQLDRLMIRQDGTLRLQPCQSPVWDTALTLKALAAAGITCEHAAARRAVQWLLDKEVRRRGDWAQTVPAEPSGWFFEHRNAFYPDVDDTAMVMMALRQQLGRRGDRRLHRRQPRLVAAGRAPSLPQARQVASRLSQADRTNGPGHRPSDIGVHVREACQRACRWVLAMQNRDGGWGAFDKDNDCQVLCYVPFADHNAMIDPSTPDITGRVLEALGQWGVRVGQPPIDRAVRFLRRTQQPDGSWFGRWGVNYIYGTWQALTGMRQIGVPRNDPAVVRGARWLAQHQQDCGGWGESADSYADPRLRGQGPVTASQTAWALLGLAAAGQGDSSAVTRGIRYLLQTQRADGTWQEEPFTGTGFPLVFYLRYHLYPVYFPLLALAAWRDAHGHNSHSAR